MNEAAARPDDYVRKFIEQLEHPETRLHTDTRCDGDDVWSGTSWGEAGRTAILSALKRSRDLESALWRAQASLANAAQRMRQECNTLGAAALDTYRVADPRPASAPGGSSPSAASEGQPQ